MQRRIAVLVGLFGLFMVVSIGITLLQKHRANQALLYSVNNVRELSQFVEIYTTGVAGMPPAEAGKPRFAPDPRFPPTPVDKLVEMKINPVVPSGTMPHATLPPEERLSWLVPLLPTFNQSRQNTAAIFDAIDKTLAWDAEANKTPSQNALNIFTSYAQPPERVPGQAAVTQFVGLGGIGIDGPKLPATDPRAGCFRYDVPTAFTSINDGLSHTILIGEISTNLGPWIRGGPSTIRPLDISPEAPGALGAGGQFGGNHVSGAIFGFADHSVRVLNYQTHRDILHGLITINGAGQDPLPGE
jgi:hypothetical protein